MAHRESTRAHVYKWVFGLNFLMILFIFAEPTAKRILESVWQRGHFVYVATASLDLHAFFGFGFLGLFAAQIALGFRARAKGGRPKSGTRHRRLGRTFAYVILPLFILGGAWVIIDRAFLLGTARSTLFHQHRAFVVIEMLHVLGLIAYFAVRGVRTIRRKDIEGHVDSMLGLFLSAGLLATIRLLYAIIWATIGENPLSISGTYLLAVAVTFVELVVVFGLAGRLTNNRTPLWVFAGSTIVMAVLGLPLYSVWDTPVL
ncbi:MAG: hypothetical protein AAF799_13235 [Myxococcota bacterium]